MRALKIAPTQKFSREALPILYPHKFCKLVKNYQMRTPHNFKRIFKKQLNIFYIVNLISVKYVQDGFRMSCDSSLWQCITSQGTVVNSYLQKKSNSCHIFLSVYIWLPVTFSVSHNNKRRSFNMLKTLHELFRQCLIVYQKRCTVEPLRIGKKF